MHTHLGYGTSLKIKPYYSINRGALDIPITPSTVHLTIHNDYVRQETESLSSSKIIPQLVLYCRHIPKNKMNFVHGSRPSPSLLVLTLYLLQHNSNHLPSWPIARFKCQPDRVALDAQCRQESTHIMENDVQNGVCNHDALFHVEFFCGK